MPRTISAIVCLLLLTGFGAPARARDEPLLAPLSDGASVELPSLDATIPPPSEVLGYPLGERFTHWERIAAYLERLDAASDRVTSWSYGETYEGRPLRLIAVSAPENIARLEELRARHLRLADPGALAAAELEALLDGSPVVVWLGYGVHGNESSSAEAAMGTAYVLAAAGGDWAELLEQAVVLIDPLTNPDGRERYVHLYETRRGAAPDARPLAAEHWEPWPGGRQNHYLFDLNRDWTWATQRETRDRLAAYRDWEPQVYVDLHEMRHDSTYFFPPAADPIHPAIPASTVRWLEVFGRANGSAFDRRGWLYYVRENFDLFYPGYGDSYPALRGVLGMTYEMAGHGRAGQAVERADGTLLTLADRVARHLTSSLATVRTAAEHRRALLEDFVAGRREALAGAERRYLLEPGAPEARAAVELLELHGIEVRQLARPTRARVRHLRESSETTRELPAGTISISTRQPLGRLVRVLMEREAGIPEEFIARQRQRLEQNRSPEFYDITAWSLPLAYNLDAWVTEDRLAASEPVSFDEPAIRGEGGLGYLLPPRGLAGYRFAAALAGRGLRHRLAVAAVAAGGRLHPAGTLFVPTRGNPEDLEATLAQLAGDAGVTLERVDSGYADEGVTLGSNSVIGVKAPRVGLVSGPGVSATGFGHLWHLFDRTLGLAHHRLDVLTLGRLDLSELDVLVLPSGSYGATLGERGAESVERWVEKGGVLVAVGRAVAWLREHEITGVKAWEEPEPDDSREALEVTRLIPGDRPLYTPGAALATELGGPHPLLAGLGSPPPVLYRDTAVLLPSGDPQKDLLVAHREDPILAGFAWDEASERLRGALLAGVERRGRGAVVVLAQDPIYRGFWRATAPILVNAVMYGPSLNDRGRLYETEDERE